MRSPEKCLESLEGLNAGEKEHKVSVIKGDVTKPESLPSAIAGCDAGIIFAAQGSGYWSAKDVDFHGVKNVANAAKEAGNVGRIVLVSSGLVTPKNRFHPIRIMLNNMRWGVLDNKFSGEEALRHSGHSYCIIRPGRLTNDEQGKSILKANQGDKTTGSVSRADVAAVCVAALRNPSADRITLELSVAKDKDASHTSPPLDEQLECLFEGLKRDE